MQIAAYCALVEEHYGVAPPYGIIKYGTEAEFPIDWDDELKKLLSEKLEEMRRYLRENQMPQRNHRRYGKCASCSRRTECPQRIEKDADAGI